MRSVTSSRVMGLPGTAATTAAASASERFMVPPVGRLLHLLEKRAVAASLGGVVGEARRGNGRGRFVGCFRAAFLQQARAVHEEIDQVVADAVVVRVMV